MKNRHRLALLVLLAVNLAIVGAVLRPRRLEAGPAAVGTVKPSGLDMPVYATSAQLAAAPTAFVTAGALAWVSNQGTWAWAPSCPETCDRAATCVTAGAVDGGLGCWLRSTTGFPAACVRSAWTIDPASGNDSANGSSDTPLATAAELARRLAGCVVNQAVTISVVADLNGDDFFSAPSIGPVGYVVLDCQPGATTLYTSPAGISSFHAQGSGGEGFAGTNSPASITTTGANYTAVCAGGSCVGYRIRFTSGLRAGTVAWIMAYAGSNTLVLSDPEMDPWIADGTTRPAPGSTGLVSTSPQSGDHFVIEKLALVNTPAFPNWISGDESNGDNAKLVIHSCASSVTVQFPDYAQAIFSDVNVPYYGNPWVVSFIASYPGWITGTFAGYASLWDDYGFAPFTTTSPYLFGCAILGDARLNGAAVYQGTVIQEHCAICPAAGGESLVEVGSANLNLNGLGVLGGILTVQGGATLSINGANGLWGNGADGGPCVHVRSGASLTSVVTVGCGDAGATSVAGTTLSWASISDAGGFSNRGAFAGPVN